MYKMFAMSVTFTFIRLTVIFLRIFVHERGIPLTHLPCLHIGPWCSGLYQFTTPSYAQMMSIISLFISKRYWRSVLSSIQFQEYLLKIILMGDSLHWYTNITNYYDTILTHNHNETHDNIPSIITYPFLASSIMMFQTIHKVWVVFSTWFLLNAI